MAANAAERALWHFLGLKTFTVAPKSVLTGNPLLFGKYEQGRL